MLTADLWADHSLITDFFYKAKAHICHCGASVQTPLGLHLQYNVLKHFLFVLIQMKFFKDKLIALNELAGCKTDRQIGLFCVVPDQVDDCV